MSAGRKAVNFVLHLSLDGSNAMSSTTDRSEIEALFQRLAKAHYDHDADAIAESYAPDAEIYDLAPPLRRRGMSREGVATWLAGSESAMRAPAARLDA